MLYVYSDEVEEDIATDLTGRPTSMDISMADRKEIRRQPSLAFDRRTSTVNEAYLQFVNTLLKECKMKVSSGYILASLKGL